MIIERRGRPGLIGLAERTSALAGSTSALAGSTSALAGSTSALAGSSSALTGQVEVDEQRRDREEQEQYSAAHQQARIETAALAALAHAAPPAPAAPAQLSASGGASLLDDLQRLAELRRSGLLSEEEFAAGKAKLLR
ncbi:SHOCT domain-containing protein [Nesterenkonia sp. E16_7]|uniref:SHOCT domain-containing protein n=1 Tax=unclassified Nesterenkonia TaxID=2629769 RepID=UPI001A934DC5|nr:MULTISPECIES: SHOCT domain-containing protein [unclassified Nesterenkonia]MBO0595622.1 SHOCT domain-containing protein [Nesterenkonia sp. E16_10]MBO0598571.1 SHOCT domain-containing protein [Nesterenkonia sp. E16_7]